MGCAAPRRNTALVRGKLDVAPGGLEVASGLFSALLAHRRVSLFASLAHASNPILAQGLHQVAINTTITAPPMPLWVRRYRNSKLRYCAAKSKSPSAFCGKGRGEYCGWAQEQGWSEVSLSVRVQVAVAAAGGQSPMNVTKMSASRVLLGYGNRPWLPLVDGAGCHAIIKALTISTSTVASVDDAGFGQFVGTS